MRNLFRLFPILFLVLSCTAPVKTFEVDLPSEGATLPMKVAVVDVKPENSQVTCAIGGGHGMVSIPIDREYGKEIFQFLQQQAYFQRVSYLGKLPSLSPTLLGAQASQFLKTAFENAKQTEADVLLLVGLEESKAECQIDMAGSMARALLAGASFGALMPLGGMELHPAKVDLKFRLSLYPTFSTTEIWNHVINVSCTEKYADMEMQHQNVVENAFKKCLAQVYSKALSALASENESIHSSFQVAKKQFGEKPPSVAEVPSTSAKPSASPQSRFSETPVAVEFARAPVRDDDIAVIIGNGDYTTQGKDIPDVTPAYADAAGIKRYVTQALGVREGNIIHLKDATSAQLVRVFGSHDDPRGQLYNWVHPEGHSRVFVYYAGHGAPGDAAGNAYLIPVDAHSQHIALNGYPLARLYKNLAHLPAESVTVVLEACFSGASSGGTVVPKSSRITVGPAPVVPERVTLMAAGGADQLASWEEDESHSLFTKYFLLGMSGQADQPPAGNGDGQVAMGELESYLKKTLTYFARRYYGRDQVAQIRPATR